MAAADMPRWRWRFAQLLRKLWVRAGFFAVLGGASALAAVGAERFLPFEPPDLISAEAISSLLDIIASSMLAVTTFSLSTMTAAYAAATSNVTPRTTRLLIEDRISQNVLSTFLGSFLFSIVSLIVLNTGAYGPSGRLVLFAVTVGVVVLLVGMLVRWIDYLTKLGRVGETTRRVEAVARAAIEARVAEPWLGGVALGAVHKAPPAGAHLIRAGAVGYLQHIDMPSLSACADAAGQEVFILHNPGAFLAEDDLLAWLPASVEEGLAREIRAAFSLGDLRNFDQDPRFGLAVLSEIASRALSPAVNDMGTAIDVIGRGARLMALWGAGQARAEAPAPCYPRLHVPALCDADLLEDAFMLIARDGAGMIEVQLRLQKVLAGLARLGPAGFRAAAQAQAALAAARAEAALPIAADRARLAAEIESLGAQASSSASQ